MSQQGPANNESELIDRIRSIDVAAPEALHRRIAELAAGEPTNRRPRWGFLGAPTRRPALAGAFALLVVVVVVAVVTLSGGGSGSRSLTLRRASALTLLPATAAAPGENASDRSHLAASVEGIAFPYWDERLGWRATGSRSDRIDGRSVRTVFYADGAGQRVGYAIVAGRPAPRASGTARMLGGVTYRVSHADGAPVVTWLRDGRLCVVSGRGLSSATLLRLASWGAPSSDA